MSTKHEIELFISNDGEIKVHTKGIKGAGCIKVLDSLAKELGQEKERTLTGEYYELSDKNISGTEIKRNISE